MKPTIFISVYKGQKEIATVSYGDDGERKFGGDFSFDAEFDFDFLTIQTQGYVSCNSWIQTNYVGIPCVRNVAFVTYHGDFAKFIWNNLPGESFC